MEYFHGNTIYFNGSFVSSMNISMEANALDVHGSNFPSEEGHWPLERPSVSPMKNKLIPSKRFYFMEVKFTSMKDFCTSIHGSKFTPMKTPMEVKSIYLHGSKCSSEERGRAFGH